MLVIFVRAKKYVIEAILLIAVYGLTQAAYIPAWTLFIIIIIIGIDLTKNLLNAFAGA
jgi:hypothetical protein